MFKSVIFFISLVGNFALATSPTSDVEFKNSTIHFHISKTANKFSISDDLGKRDVEVKSCNKKIVEEFWKQLTAKVTQIQTSNADKSAPREPWLMFDGVKYKLLSFDTTLHYFNNVPMNSNLLIAESRRVCKNK